MKPKLLKHSTSKKLTFIVVFAFICTLLSSITASALTFNGTASGGGGGSTSSATGNYALKFVGSDYDNPPGYRFTVYNMSGS